jgi:hypothetical protein
MKICCQVLNAMPVVWKYSIFYNLSYPYYFCVFKMWMWYNSKKCFLFSLSPLLFICFWWYLVLNSGPCARKALYNLSHTSSLFVLVVFGIDSHFMSRPALKVILLFMSLLHSWDDTCVLSLPAAGRDGVLRTSLPGLALNYDPPNPHLLSSLGTPFFLLTF